MLNSRSYIILLLASLALYFPRSIIAEDYEVKDFLKERWFETEIIVFEYPSTLSVNEPERLAINTQRTWPKQVRTNKKQSSKNPLEHSFQDSKPSFQLNSDDQIIKSLLTIDPQCLGYPNLVKKDPLHPNFQKAGITPKKIEQYLPRHFQQPVKLLAQENSIEQDDRPTILQEEIRVASHKNNFRLRTSAFTDLISKIGALEVDLHQTAFSWLPHQTFQLGDEYVALKRATIIRPVFHGRWRQPVPERDSPKPILVSFNSSDSPKILEKQFSKIEGIMHLTAKKFLHLNFQLWYHADGLGMSPLSLPGRQQKNSGGGKYMELKETRRMRSGELHYFDHPKFGIIANIDEVKIPQEFHDSLEALISPKI